MEKAVITKVYYTVAMETFDKQRPFLIIRGTSNGSVINLAVSEFGILVYQRAMYKLTEGFFGNCDSFPDINFLFILMLTPVLFLAFSDIHDPLLINKCLNPKIPLSVCRYIINKH